MILPSRVDSFPWDRIGPGNCHGGEKGFTLLEMIMVLVLLGIMGAGVGLGLNQVVKGYLFTKEAADTVSKAQLALLRISKEVRVAGSVTNGASDSITFVAQHDIGLTQTYTISQPGGTDTVTLDDGGNSDILVDHVSSFTIKYYDSYDDASPASVWSASTKIIEVLLSLYGPNNEPTLFVTRVAPRNI